MRQTRHSSVAFALRYIRPGQIWHDNPSAALGLLTQPSPRARGPSDRRDIAGSRKPLDALRRRHRRSRPPLSITFQSLQQSAGSWPVTTSTPEGPASLLSTSRSLWALAWFDYDLLAVSASWSLFAVEAALRTRLQSGPKPPLNALIQRALAQALVTPGASEHLHAGRELRNSFAHAQRQGTWTPGMAGPVLQASHQVVAQLYTDDGENGATLPHPWPLSPRSRAQPGRYLARPRGPDGRSSESERMGEHAQGADAARHAQAEPVLPDQLAQRVPGPHRRPSVGHDSPGPQVGIHALRTLHRQRLKAAPTAAEGPRAGRVGGVPAAFGHACLLVVGSAAAACCRRP